MNKLITIFIFITATLLTQAAIAVESTPWDQLSADQQRLLQAVENEWQTMDAKRQSRLIKGTDRWLQMDSKQHE